MEYYYKQIDAAEVTLNQMETELEAIMLEDKWPLEVRFFIGKYRVKHSFLYQGNNFMVRSLAALIFFIESSLHPAENY